MAPLDWTIFSLANGEVRRSQLAADWLRGVAAVGGAVSVIGQEGGGGGVSTDDKLQTVWRLGDQWNDEAAVKVSGPHMVNLEDIKHIWLMWAETNILCFERSRVCAQEVFFSFYYSDSVDASWSTILVQIEISEL